jgi:site-specific recombinase XerD
MSGRLEKENQAKIRMDKKLSDLPEIFTAFYNWMDVREKSYTTMDNYINHVSEFMVFFVEQTGNEKDEFYKMVSDADIEKYMASIRRKTINGEEVIVGDDIRAAKWSSLNTFFEWLVQREYIKKNPMKVVSRPKNNTEHKVSYLTKVEINKLLRAIDSNPNATIAMRDKTIISLALATALRVSALVNINIEDIDFDNNVINVIEKRQKIRSISIGDNIKSMLREWILLRNTEFEDDNSSALFISQKRNRLSVDAVADMLAKYCADAGIKRITPHKLRASAACALARNNIPVKAIAKQLGHNSISTTMRYIDVFTEDAEKSKNILDNLF